ncbi:MAG: hypothetical protein ACE149_16515 [Armatimonadota bacterium]
MQVAVGSYTGDGNDVRGITGVGFQPDLVIIKRTDSAVQPVWRSSAMAGDTSAYLGNNVANVSNRIESLDGDGFTIGDATEVNANGGAYHWWAFRNDGQSDLAVGSYVGNGSDNRSITGVGFQPDVVAAKGDRASYGYWRPSSLAGDLSLAFHSSGSYANLIQALESDGFQVGTQVEVNYSGTTYYWFAFKAVAGICQVGSYTGDGVDNRSITGVGFQPDLVWVKRQDTGYARAKPSTLAGDSATYLIAGTANANVIQALESDGFQIGTDSSVNTSTETYHWVAWQAGYTGQPVQKSVSDSIALIDAVTDRQIGASDTIGLGEAVQIASPRDAADGITLSESVALALGLQSADGIALSETVILDQGKLRSQLQLQASIANRLRRRLQMHCEIFRDRVRSRLALQCTISPQVRSRLTLQATIMNQALEAAAAGEVIAPAAEVTFL